MGFHPALATKVGDSWKTTALLRLRKLDLQVETPCGKNTLSLGRKAVDHGMSVDYWRSGKAGAITNRADNEELRTVLALRPPSGAAPTKMKDEAARLALNSLKPRYKGSPPPDKR